MTGGSQQLRTFRRLVRDGAAMTDAAEQAGLSLGEARLTIKADKTDPPPPEAFDLIGHNEGCDMEADTLFDEETGEIEPEMDNPLVELAADTLRGDIRDSLLNWFKATPKPWSQLGEKEQRDLADAADRYAMSLIRQASKLIAAGERPCIVATLVEYKEKDGVEAKLKLPARGEVIAALHEACGREVLIVASGEEQFDGEQAPAEIDADAPKFPDIGAEYQEAA